MTTIMASLVDAAVLLAIGLIAVALARKRSAAVRHAILAATVGGAMLMPAWELLLPAVPVIRYASGSQVLSSEAVWTSAPMAATFTQGGAPAVAAVPLWTIAGWFWAVGALVICAGLITGLLRLSRVITRCTPAPDNWRTLADELAGECGIRRQVALLQSDDPSVLVAFGIFKPRIILPAGAALWDDERRRIVLRHELAHIRRHDAALQLVAETLRAAQWINPLAWLACRRLRQESEYACDDAVLRGGVRATDYAAHLLDIARHVSASGTAPASAPAIAHPSTLERRIVAMLHRQQNRVPLTHRGWAAAATIALGISIPLAAASVAPADDTVVTAAPSPDVALAVPQPTQDPPPPPPPPPPPRPAVRNAVAQGEGVIAGRVVDPSGAVLPGVHMTLTEAGSSAASSATTNAMGRFEFKNVRPGQYDLVAQLVGFSTVTNRVKLAASQTIDGKLTLPLGTLQETITVACAGSALGSFMERLMPTLHAQDQPPPPPPPPPVRVGGNIKAPTKVKDVRPSCPTTPAVDTLVRLTARIGPDGVPFEVMAEPASGNTAPPQAFVDAAIAAVNQWAFTPTLLNGRPTEVVMKVKVTFKRQ